MDGGSAKLEDLIHRIRFSQYNPEVDLDEAMCGAMPVKADRISVPERAGILNPCDHLSPEQLREFKAMHKDIPIPSPAPGDCRACHEVDEAQWPALLRKLHDANMIEFLPAEDAFRDEKGVVKGGVFLQSLKNQKAIG